MSQPQDKPARGKEGNRIAVWVLLGFLLPLSFGLYRYWDNSRYSPIEHAAARQLNIGTTELSDWTKISNRIERTREITDEDWAYIKESYKNKDKRVLAVSLLMFAKEDFVHRAEAIGLLNQFLAEGRDEGNVAAVSALRSLGDPGWKVHAKRLMTTGSESSRASATDAFAHKLQP